MNTIQAAHAQLVARLAAIKPRPIPVFPEPEDFMERIAHMQSMALAVDQYILALGRECQENVRGSFDISLFTAPLSNTLDGNAIYELECIAEELADEMADEEVA